MRRAMRKGGKFLKLQLLIWIFFVVIIHLTKWNEVSHGDFGEMAYTTPIRKYIEIIDFLKSIHISLVVLDPSMLSFNEIDESFVTFGIFEDQSHVLRKSIVGEGFIKNLPKGWTYRQHMQMDYRILNIVKTKSLIPAHFTFTSREFKGCLHLAVIFPRSSAKYYWISEFTDHDFPAKNYSIPMPMAVEPFECRRYRLFENRTFCVPRNWTHYIWQLQYARFLECHYEDVVWKFEKEYPAKSVNLRPHATALREMMRIARKFEVPIVLTYGSLLGWYRQCSFMVHTSDLDALMFVGDFNEAIFRELWFSYVLKMRTRLGYLEQGLEFQFFAAGTVMFDLFMVYPKGHVYYSYMIDTYDRELHRYPSPMLSDICSADLLGVLVYVPCDPITYILTEYGPNWFKDTRSNYANNSKAIVIKWNSTEVMNFNVHWYRRKMCSNPTVYYGCDYRRNVKQTGSVEVGQQIGQDHSFTAIIQQPDSTSFISPEVQTENKFDVHSAWKL